VVVVVGAGFLNEEGDHYGTWGGRVDITVKRGGEKVGGVD
jgi:hypothetical protein